MFICLYKLDDERQYKILNKFEDDNMQCAYILDGQYGYLIINCGYTKREMIK